MSDEEAVANIVELMMTFRLEIKALSDDLKCLKCKFVLKNACQMPCGCRFCRTCIDDVMARGDQFCPGGLQECGRAPLWSSFPDHMANKSILKLTAKCPHADCPYECPLVDMESHMRVCSGKNIDSPLQERAQGTLPGEEASGHLLQESRSHSEILIVTVANISRDMEMLKREMVLKDEQRTHMENEMELIKDEMKLIKFENKSIKGENKLINDENKSIEDEIKLIKDENKSIKDENKAIKDENKLIKDENKSIKNENKAIKDENKSIKDEIKLIKDENKSIKDENKAINDINKSIKIDIKSVKDEMKSIKIENELIKYENKSIKNEIKLINDYINKSIKIDMKSVKDEMKSIKIVNDYIKIENRTIKDENKSIKDEIKSIKDENKLIKDEYKLIKYVIKSIKDEINVINDVNKSIKVNIKSVKDEMKSIKIENELINVKYNLIGLEIYNCLLREKEILSDRVRQLSEKLESEIDERRPNDERDSAVVTTVTGALASNWDEMKPVRDDILSVKNQFDRLKYQMESIQMKVGLGQLDDWLIEEDVTKTDWPGSIKTSGKFGGGGSAHTYELSSRNSASRGELRIFLRIWLGLSDSLLEWPFRGEVTITVAHRDRRESCSRQTQQFRIERPVDNQYNVSDPFKFQHATLRGAGLVLEHGVRVSCQIVCVSCQIVPDVDQ